MLQTLVEEEKVVSDPRALNPKTVTIVHLARANISLIDNFQRYINLEVLYLNDNRLEKVENLDQCFRLRELYLHRNRLIATTGLDKLRYLRKLTLNDNRLKNLIATLPNLRHMHLLLELDLYGNPLANEHHYRLHVLHTLPSLTILDRQAIRNSDHAKAARLYRDRNSARQLQNIVFGRHFSASEIQKSTAHHDHVVSSLTDEMVQKAKKIEQRLSDRKKKELLSLYGDCGDNLSADSNAIPLPSRFHSKNQEIANRIMSRVDLRETFQTLMLARPGLKESSPITITEASRLITEFQITGRRPSPEDAQRVMEHLSKIATQPEPVAPVKNAPPTPSEPGVPMSTFLDLITALEWAPQPVDELHRLYDRHHQQAVASFTDGNHAAAFRSITLALAVQQLIS